MNEAGSSSLGQNEALSNERVSERVAILEQSYDETEDEREIRELEEAARNAERSSYPMPNTATNSQVWNNGDVSEPGNNNTKISDKDISDGRKFSPTACALAEGLDSPQRKRNIVS